jgi:hypothetical protein
MVIKQLTGDLTLSKLTGTAHGHLFHWTLINLLSPTSLHEKITCIYWRKKQHTQPHKPSAPPSQAHCQSFSGGSFACTPLGLNTGPFCGPRTQKGLYQCMAITLHPTRCYVLPETCKKVSTTSSWENIKVV